jgi:hypothetical protein
MRGSLVIARDYKGCGLVRRVWDLGRNLIYLSEESQFQQLSTGMNALTPIGFPAEDVFTYDPALTEGIASGSLDWGSMRSFTALSRQDQSTICVK